MSGCLRATLLLTAHSLTPTAIILEAVLGQSVSDSQTPFRLKTNYRCAQYLAARELLFHQDARKPGSLLNTVCTLPVARAKAQSTVCPGGNLRDAAPGMMSC